MDETKSPVVALVTVLLDETTSLVWSTGEDDIIGEGVDSNSAEENGVDAVIMYV